jgi:hypothetical protein
MSDVKSAMVMMALGKETDKEEIEPQEKLTIETIRLKENTTEILGKINKEQIVRFGDGWIIRCQKCDRLLEIGDTHKTFITKNKKVLRIAPSIICSKETGGCGWNVVIMIKPEINIETIKAIDTDTEEESEKDGITIE